MAKKRKTKDQKIKAESRHQEYHLSATYNIPIKNEVSSQSLATPSLISPSVKAVSYPYLKKDLSKTLALTASILIFQIVSLIILHHHSLNLLGMKISY